MENAGERGGDTDRAMRASGPEASTQARVNGRDAANVDRDGLTMPG